MAAERLSMGTTHEILRLKWACGLTNRQIARSCGVARSTVADRLRRATGIGVWDRGRCVRRAKPALPSG